jgi:hypothetical protein
MTMEWRVYSAGQHNSTKKIIVVFLLEKPNKTVFKFVNPKKYVQREI